MKKSESIFNLMTKNLITLNLTDTLYTAEKRLKVNHIRHIPVVENDELIGLLSLSDLKRISFIDAYNKDGMVDTAIYNMLSIKDLMIKNPITVSSSTTILDVSKLFVSKEFHSLPVVDNNKLVGIITTTDLLLYFIQLC